MLVEILVSVNRPVTSEGLMSNVTPFPLDVEIFVVIELSMVPPLRAPPAPIAHEPPVFVALKLPLLCAKAVQAPANTTSTVINIVNLKVLNFFLLTAKGSSSITSPVFMQDQ